jgi:RNA polymerase sigma factor (sigma-70 family)
LAAQHIIIRTRNGQSGVPFMTKARQSFGSNIESLFDAGVLGEQTDRQLLERFRARSGEMAELAFAVLVERHGSMVFHTCRSILRDRHAAEDAFQATFLILSRRAGSLWFRDSLGPWLYGVACRVAWCARKATVRRRMHEQRAAELSALIMDDAGWDDRDAVLYDELNRLPERYRLAVMMCDLEGLTQEQAARRLGWPAGTVRSRLARARRRLRERLTRRGLVPGIIPLGISPPLPAVPASLATATVERAVSLGAACAATSTMAISEGVMKIMIASKFKLILTFVLAGGVLVSGTAMLGHRAMGVSQSAPAEAKPQEQRPDEAPAQSNTSVPVGVDSLGPEGRARLAIVRKLRDAMFKAWTNDKGDLSAYLEARKQLNDFIDSTVLMSDAGRVHYQEVQVRGLERLEKLVKEADAGDKKAETDVLMIEAERRAAEAALARAKAKTGAPRNALKARLDAARKVRDAMFLKFKAGQIDTEKYMTWHKRHDDVAHAMMMADGGNRVGFFEGRLADLEGVQQLVKKLYDNGQVPQCDIDIVEYYHLEAEEALAIEKAQGERVLGQ